MHMVIVIMLQYATECKTSYIKSSLAIDRAGRYLGILVVPRYWSQTIHVSSKFQRNDIIDFGIIVVLPSLETLFEAKRVVIAVLLKTIAWYLQTKSMEKI